MALIATGLKRRWLSVARRSLRRTTIILLAMLVVGATIAIWARLRIDALLTVDDGAELVFRIDDIEGDCGTPSVYLDPEAAGDRSRYRLLIDFLGGANRFPMLGGGDTVPVLKLPSSRAPGVGVGRGLPETCLSISMSISGSFTGHRFEDRIAGVDAVPPANTPHMTLNGPDGQHIQLDYRKPARPSVAAALVALTLDGVADRWQQGSKRVTLVNEGSRDLNVFVHEEAGYLFVNEMDSLVRPIGVRRAYVDVHLASRGEAADNAVVVYRRSPTAEIELQHALVGISTIFGIGVSLFVEGVIVLLISFASTGAASGGRPGGTSETSFTAIEEGQERQ